MFHLIFTVIWNLYLLLVDGVFWSLVIVIGATLLFAGIAQRIFLFPTAPIQAPESPGISSQCLTVPRARWGKAFSYHSQDARDASNSSSDSDNGDPHQLILRSLQAHQEENANELGDTVLQQHPLNSASRDLRRSKWRSKQFPRIDQKPRNEIKARNGSVISVRPRLQRQETVGGQFIFDIPSPIHSDEQEFDAAAAPRQLAAVSSSPCGVDVVAASDQDTRENLLPDPLQQEQASPVPSSERPLPSDFSISFAEDTSNDLTYPSTPLVTHGSHLLSVCGTVEVSFYYDAIDKTIFVTVIQASNLDSVAHAGLQIKLCLLPTKRLRFRTKLRHGKNPKFHECFHLKGLPPEDVNSMGLRIRLYMYEKLVRGQLIGECVVGFGSINLDIDTTLWLTLEPRKALLFDLSSNGGELRSLSRSDSTLSAQSMPLNSSTPELLLGLLFNDITGHLKVEVIKGSRFRSPSLNRPVDTFVKLSLLSSNAQEISRAKTSVRRAQPNPIFRESFLFPVALFQLSDVTLVCSIYIRRSMKRKQLLGWLTMGYNNTSADCCSHWEEFQESRDQVCRWHALATP